MGRIRVKICGITNLNDALAAADAGADALGFMFAESPRRVDIETARAIQAALPPFVTTVGVFVNENEEYVLKTARDVGLHVVQLHGEETPQYVAAIQREFPVIKAFRVRGEESLVDAAGYERAAGLLFDAYTPAARGGTGHVFNWQLLTPDAPHRPVGPWLLAGGLNLENIEQAIALCRPYGVDLSTGVEQTPGVKDHDKIHAFLEKVRRS